MRTVRSTSIAHVIAHQGGWDEILLIGGPMLAIAALLVLAKRRVDAAAAATERPGAPSGAAPDRTGGSADG